MKVDAETAAILTVNITKGLLKVKRLPFEISASPAIFQRMMDTTLAGIPGVSVYLDDLIVSGKYTHEHAERLNQVLTRLSKAGLRLQQEKCRFGIQSVEFLGTELTLTGYTPPKRRCKLSFRHPNQVTRQLFKLSSGFLDSTTASWKIE